MKLLENKRILLLIFLLLFLLIIILVKPGKRYDSYNPVTLPTKNFTLNKTEYSFLDTVVLIGLEELKIRNVSVEITPLTDEIRDKFGKDIELNAAIVGNKYNFILYVSHLNRETALLTISHELIHLEQYHTERLKVISLSEVRWDGVILNKDVIENIPYEQREWEKEAFKFQSVLEQKIRKILF